MVKKKRRHNSILKDKGDNFKVSKWWLAPVVIGITINAMLIFYFGIDAIGRYFITAQQSFKILIIIVFFSSAIGLLCMLAFKNFLRDKYPLTFFFTLLSVYFSLFILLSQHYDNSKHICLESKEGKCVDWRAAEKCEINPNEEGCFCDIMQDRILGGTIYWECLKAHEADECDKQNPKYIKDHFGCRIKTVHDFSCKELLEHAVRDELFCINSGYFSATGGFCSWIDPKDEYNLRCK